MDLFSLHWNNYHSEVSEALGSLRNDEDLVDVTISCDGKKLKAHKVLLSACSNYFRDIFKENPCQHPVIVFRNFKFKDLQAVVDYIYMGEVSVEQGQLESVLEIAQLLQVKGLTDGLDNSDEELQGSVSKATEHVEASRQKPSLGTSVPLSPPLKRRKTCGNEEKKGHPSVTIKSSCVESKVDPDDNSQVRSNSEDGSVHVDITETCNELLHKLRSLTSDSNSGTDQLSEDKTSDFQATVLKQFADINSVLTKQSLQLKRILKCLCETEFKLDQQNEIESAMCSMIPCKNHDMLSDLEKFVSNKENSKELILYLRRFGGSSVPDSVKGILKALLDDSVAADYSWLGQKGKKVFSQLRLAKVITDTVQVMFKEVTLKEIEKPIRSWLVGGKNRHIRKSLKENQENQYDDDDEEEEEDNERKELLKILS